MLYEIITNRVLIIPLCAWAMAQMLKVIVILVQEKRLDLRLLLISGGMPSAHSALASALATAVALTEGLGSVAFGISAIFALVIMYDAASIRQSVGQQSQVLNRILRELRLRRPATELGRDLRELMGHTQFQVITGGIVGIAVAWLGLIVAAT